MSAVPERRATDPEAHVPMNILEAHEFWANRPGATRDLEWASGDTVRPVYSVGAKTFTPVGGRPASRPPFKADRPRFLELADRDGFGPAPCLARAKRGEVDRVRRLTETGTKLSPSEARQVVLSLAAVEAQAAPDRGRNPAMSAAPAERGTR